jgi:integrase
MNATEPRYCPVSTVHRKPRHGTGSRGRARATLTRRRCAIAGSCKNTVEGELREHSPAAHVRRPRADYESHAAALDRNELSALPAAARLGPPAERALISLLVPNGLRVSAATGAGIEHLDLDRGHRTVTITRTGGTVVTIPLGPRTARAIDLATGERTGAPVFLADDGAAAGPARHLHRRRLRRNAAPVTGTPAGKAPPDDLNRQTELPAAADPEHPAVTHRDLRANANRRPGRFGKRRK